MTDLLHHAVAQIRKHLLGIGNGHRIFKLGTLNAKLRRLDVEPCTLTRAPYAHGGARGAVMQCLRADEITLGDAFAFGDRVTPAVVAQKEFAFDLDAHAATDDWGNM